MSQLFICIHVGLCFCSHETTLKDMEITESRGSVFSQVEGALVLLVSDCGQFLPDRQYVMEVPQSTKFQLYTDLQTE